MANHPLGFPPMNKLGTVLMLVFFMTACYPQFIALFVIYLLIRGFIREDLRPNSFPGLRDALAYWAAILQEPVLLPSPKPVKASRPHTFRPAPPPLSHKWMPGRPLILVNESDDDLRDFIAHVLKC